MRDFAGHFEHRISVRNGSASMTDHQGPGTPTDRIHAWLVMVGLMEGLLPDLDLAVNVMDESRVVVPWEQMSNYIYTLRLLLEYARLCDDNREQLGFSGGVGHDARQDEA
ncbi:hypothetical protein G6011_08408 [Alternaria panax]|uniref:Uncharacterized protein n=1 Tax=Alternaria panax TaxID=48097 RepID=A0AAD4I628_9PLEO|nr:hypothetical protein G6011_08408 [Alternaria panax]